MHVILSHSLICTSASWNSDEECGGIYDTQLYFPSLTADFWYIYAFMLYIYNNFAGSSIKLIKIKCNHDSSW